MTIPAYSGPSVHHQILAPTSLPTSTSPSLIISRSRREQIPRQLLLHPNGDSTDHGNHPQKLTTGRQNKMIDEREVESRFAVKTLAAASDDAKKLRAEAASTTVGGFTKPANVVADLGTVAVDKGIKPANGSRP